MNNKKNIKEKDIRETYLPVKNIIESYILGIKEEKRKIEEMLQGKKLKRRLRKIEKELRKWKEIKILEKKSWEE